MPSLFDWQDTYPQKPGFKRNGTSREAAQEMAEAAPDLRERCFRVIKEAIAPVTADEVAAKLGKSVLSIRPRVSELARLGRIVEAEQRRRNKSGKRAATWRLPG